MQKTSIGKRQLSLTSKSTLEHGVENHENYAYSTTLFVGSHRQPLNLLLDSGSTIMWVQSPECPNPTECHGESAYRSELSSSFADQDLTQTIQYGIGKVVGNVVTDSVSWVEDPLPSQVSDQIRFLLIYSAENLNTLNQDGLVGLAPSSIDPNQKTLLEEMFEQGQLRDMMFSLYLGLPDDESKIWLGGYDRAVVKQMVARHNPARPVESLTDEDAEAEIRWLPLVSKYYWMTELTGASIAGEEWPISVDSIIFDSGSSINHIPTKEYNILLNVITRDHRCKTVLNPLETYYCECQGASDDSFPTLALKSNGITLNFKPQDYLVFEQFSTNEKSCMISFQEESRGKTSFWLLGDSFHRAFYTIYDGNNKRIGLVGDTAMTVVEEKVAASASFNPLIYILPGAICLLCALSICITCCVTHRIRKRQVSLERGFSNGIIGAVDNAVSNVPQTSQASVAD